MPNRILKESIRSSDTINELSPDEEVFFYRLLTACDDYGRYDARPTILRSTCYPLRVDSVTDDDIRAWLAALERVGLIICYSVNGKPYLQVVTWDNHQQIRAKRPKYPAPTSSDIICNHMIADDINGQQMQANDSICPRNPIQSESESESEGESNPIMSDEAEPPSEIQGDFDENSEAYRLAVLLRQKILENNPKARVPKLESRAFQNWCKHVDLMIRLDRRTYDEIKKAIVWSQTDPFWRCNILSPQKLREKYDQLYLQMRRPGANEPRASPARARGTPDEVVDHTFDFLESGGTYLADK